LAGKLVGWWNLAGITTLRTGQPFSVTFSPSLPGITERVKAQLRAEFFTMPNHANFQNPRSNISSPSSVGKITGADDPRQIQFGLKILF